MTASTGKVPYKPRNITEWKEWKTCEESALKHFYPKYGAYTCSILFDRSEAGIMDKAAVLRLRSVRYGRRSKQQINKEIKTYFELEGLNHANYTCNK